MINRRGFSLLVATGVIATAIPAAGAEFDWTGTWSGRGRNGRLTVIKIANGKVVSWSSNGQKQKIGASSVSKGSVSITHAEGAKVRLTPRDDNSIDYNWRGVNASSSTVLKKS